MTEPDPKAPVERRRFLTEAAAGAVGACCLLVPAAAGLVAWLDPLTPKGEGSEFVRAAALDALPPDGTPRRVTILSARTDAWTRDQAVPVGAIYLRRTAEREVVALHSVCPHAGCFIDYQPGRKMFFCPCHESTFATDGTINDPNSPSPRPMDLLEVEVRADEVWVRFRNYRSGVKDRIPV